jgi:hypothetical protein
LNVYNDRGIVPNSKRPGWWWGGLLGCDHHRKLPAVYTYTMKKEVEEEVKTQE